MPSERDSLLGLSMINGMGPVRLRLLRDHFGSYRDAFLASATDLADLPRISAKLADEIVRQRDEGAYEEEKRWAAREGIDIITELDGQFPQSLRKIAYCPPVLYVRGRVPKSLGAAIVGTRRPSLPGRKRAVAIAYQLALNGIAVVSGMARGIDASAHRGCLEGNGFTVAVMATSFARIYPSEHTHLAEQIAQTGCLISQFSRNKESVKGSFHQRNMLIAALSLGVLVVEAPGQSGAMSTAQAANKIGRKVMAFPGDVTNPLYRGNHQLIKQGAALVENYEDIVDELELDLRPVVASAGENRIAALLEKGCGPEEIVQRTGLSAGQVQRAITQLKLGL